MRYLFLLCVIVLLPGCTITTSLFVENQGHGHREGASVGATYVPRSTPRSTPLYLP